MSKTKTKVIYNIESSTSGNQSADINIYTEYRAYVVGHSGKQATIIGDEHLVKEIIEYLQS